MRRCRTAVAATLLGCGGLLAACGGSTVTATVTRLLATAPPTPSPSPTAAPALPTSPTPRPELLFAVVESHAAVNALPGYLDDTVAVVGLDGLARSKATFAPRTAPQIGNAAAVLQPDAVVAAGQVFYIDRRGVVRSLGAARGARPQPVTSFAAPVPQGYESFAVSPDGRHLIAAVDSLTAFVPPDATHPFGSGAIQARDLIEVADAGGVARILDTIATPAMPLFVGGWDAQSPIGLTDPPLGTQNGFPAGWSSPAVRLDAGGHPVGAPLGGAGCRAVEELPDTTVLCLSATPPTGEVAEVHGPTVGDWTVPLPAGFYQGFPGGPTLSADGRTVAFPLVPTAGTGETLAVMTKGAALRMLAANFAPEGWLDGDTLIGTIVGCPAQVCDMAVVHLSDGRVHDLGFKGAFVGVVQAAG